MIPSIGRIVHFVMPAGFRTAGQHRAAMITNVFIVPGDERITEKSPVSLTVFLDAAIERTGKGETTLALTQVRQDPAGREPGSWHEPEKVG